MALGMMSGLALAVDPDEILDDPALEARAREISRELRCITCQSQSIDDSDAPLAKDLRLIVRERLVAGDSDQEIIAFMTQRYGDYVLLKPALRSDTAILWFAPLIAFGAALGGVFFYFRQIQKNSFNDDRDISSQYNDDMYTENHCTDDLYKDNTHKDGGDTDNPETT